MIYGTGQFGCMAARFALDKGWPIVAAYNRAGDKIGKDLGEVMGLGRSIGVVVQDCDTADFSKLEADVALNFTTNLLKQNLPAYERLLGAGINVLCHGSEAYHPLSSDAETAAWIDALAKANGLARNSVGLQRSLISTACRLFQSRHHFRLHCVRRRQRRDGKIFSIT